MEKINKLLPDMQKGLSWHYIYVCVCVYKTYMYVNIQNTCPLAQFALHGNP